MLARSAVDYAIITLDLHGRVTSWSEGAERITLYAEPEVIGRSGSLLFTADDHDGGMFDAELTRARQEGRAVNERWHVRRDGTRFWASGAMMLLQDGEGVPHGFLNILQNRSVTQAEMERRELLVAEMTHRIKNTFATVQAVATKTGRHAGSVQDFKTQFSARLSALARSHDMTLRGGWENLPLRNVIEGALSAYAAAPGQVILDGAPVVVPKHLVTTFALAFHELATNAAKHGALSAPGGSVTVAWAVSSSRGARLVTVLWRERGGPRVRPPEHRGFGTDLLERALGQQPSITVRQSFEPDGVECRITFPPPRGWPRLRRQPNPHRELTKRAKPGPRRSRHLKTAGGMG